MADTSVYNSKNTQTISSAPASGGEFDGTYLSSKNGALLYGPTVAQAGKTSRSVACSRPMDPAVCARHCSMAQN